MSWEHNEILATVTKSYPSQWSGRVELRWVLVAGDPKYGDYACYIGEGSPEYVRAAGDKVTFFEAIARFSTIEPERYRGIGGFEGGMVEQRIVDVRDGAQSGAESG